MKRRLVKIVAVLVGFLLVVGVSAVLVLRSQWFLDRLRQGIVERAQLATGAKVEIGGLAFDWSTLKARVDSFVLHGKEPTGEAPLVRVGSATLGFRIVSAFQRKVDLLSLRVDAPQVHIVVYPDGSTNIPGASGVPRRLWSEDLLNLKIGEYEISGGEMEYDEQRVPLNFRGRNLNVKMSYDAAVPAYRGEFGSEGVRLTPPGYDPIDSTVQTSFVLEQNRVRLSNLRVSAQGMTATLNGTLDDLRTPHGTLAVRASSPLRGVVREFRLPIDPSGSGTFNGDLVVSFAGGFTYSARGEIAAKGLRYVQDLVKIENADVRGNAEVSRDGAVLRAITAHALGATVTGDAHLDRWREFRFQGEVTGLNVREAAAMATARAIPWNGTLAGTFTTSVTLQQQNLISKASLAITPAGEGDPLTGHLEVAYDQAGGLLELGSSSLATPFSRVEVDGTLGRSLRVRARTTRLEDVLPAIEFVRNSPVELPLRLNNGSVSVDGTVTGPLDNPRFRGQAAVVKGQVREFAFDSVSADVDASREEVSASGIQAARGASSATGSLSLSSRAGDFTNAGIAAQLSLRNVDFEQAARELGFTQQVAGVGNATGRISGSLDSPEANFTLDVRNPSALGERADRLRASVQYLPGSLEVTDGILNASASEARFSGTYRHPQSDWRSGDVVFDVSTPGLPTALVQRIQSPVSAVLSGRAQGTGSVRNGAFTLVSATANAAARQVVYEGRIIGEATLTADTRGSDLSVTANATLRESRIEANGAWKLEGNAPGSARIRFSRIGIDSLQALLNAPVSSVEGFVEGEATVNVALQTPKEFRAELRLANVEARPKEDPAPRLRLQPEDVILRNSQPVVMDVTAQSATVRAARFVGRNTQMDVTGTIPFDSQAGADLNVRGNIDMVILQLLRSDLQARGNATVNANIRGSLRDPAVNGQLTLAGASLYLGDLPNGVDNASGTILFDRRRATVQQLTAETGGGQVAFGGFIEFGDALVYRLQARARRVRIRYPQDVSTTFDADLSLNGSTEASTLSGVVTLTRSAFTVSTDLGQLLAETSQPAAVVDTANEYLTGMNLDIRVMNSSTFQLETSLSSGVEADVDLQLRGTPSRPGLRGLITINRGLVQVFGNQYTLERGDIRFLNPVKIEPTVDMDLSTRARGVTVNISISGTMNSFKSNYSSDPPLQSSEIIALLAVGRDPSLASSQSAPGLINNSANSAMGAGANLMLQALSAQMTNQVQRFFGASRVKIDPTLTGVDNIPQARLTLEQQVSKDITLTYITNLNRTQEQIVRVQWDVSREWSAVAVRDPNGLFGIDFQFRKRF